MALPSSACRWETSTLLPAAVWQSPDPKNELIFAGKRVSYVPCQCAGGVILKSAFHRIETHRNGCSRSGQMMQMDLTPKTLGQLVARLKADAAGKRKFPRVELRATAQVARVARLSERFPIRVRNVSAAGMSFACSEAFAAGERLTIILAGRRRKFVGADDIMRCTVRYCHRADNHAFISGVRFIDDTLPSNSTD